jgi:translocation protein SEC72
MSHSHTHAPGEVHSHSHGAPQSPMAMGLPTPDPILQALIDQDFIPVPLTLSSDTSSALCASHKLEKCDDCKVDFVNTNRLAKLLIANPNLLCPPPSNVISQKLTQVVQATKDEGNVHPFSLLYVFDLPNIRYVYRPYLNVAMLPKP